MGAHTLQEIVIIFDNSPYVDHNATFAQVAFAHSAGNTANPAYVDYGNSTAGTERDSPLLMDSSVYTPSKTEWPLL